MKLILDCNYLCHIEKSVLSIGLSYRGTRTEIIYGFLKRLLNLSTEFKTNQFLFCWDSKESIRRKLYPQYKMNRRVDKSEEDIEADKIAYRQFNLLRQKILPSMGFENSFMVDGYEGDDILAYLVKLYPGNIVVSNDEDLFQLLNDCSLYNVVKKTITTKEEFMRKYKMNPTLWIMVKSYAGCPGDNITGVERVGNITAAKFINGELNKSTKSYLKLAEPESWQTYKTNYKLVSLPLEGFTLNRRIVEEETFLKKDFQAIFMKYGLSSFLDREKFSKWEKQFQLI
jgi:5'-3' exonuclease